jgi:hypothetical protein
MIKDALLHKHEWSLIKEGNTPHFGYIRKLKDKKEAVFKQNKITEPIPKNKSSKLKQ